jgi:ubiquinone/menaquinone biosynthesis C-methylase UbiE
MDDRQVDRVRTQFTRQAETYARMRQTTDQKSLDGLVRLSGLEPHHRVLDVACGPGFLTLTFAAGASHAIGIDATDALLELARAEAARRAIANVEFRRGDAEELPFPDESFDVVACRAAFHHFARPARVLGEMRRVARSGGVLLIADMVGSEDPAKAAYHDRMERLCDPSHVRAIPESELRGLFAGAGLTERFARKGPVDIDVEEWIEHGGPSDEVGDELRALVSASLETDLSGLSVRRENGVLRFSYPSAVFVFIRTA